MPVAYGQLLMTGDLAFGSLGRPAILCRLNTSSETIVPAAQLWRDEFDVTKAATTPLSNIFGVAMLLVLVLVLVHL